jgi:hypothetical protein
MSQPVVDALQLVEVQQQHGEGPVAPLATANFPLERIQEFPLIR